MGKSKPKAPEKPKPTQHETELARQGVQKWNRYMSQYAPLEEAELGNLNRSTQNLRAGRGNADLMQEVSQDAMHNLATPNVATGLSNLGRMNAAMSAAGGVNAQDAVMGDRMQRDEAHLSAIRRGIGQAGQQTQALSSLARQENHQAISRFQTDYRSQLQKSQADNQALWGLAEAGMSIYTGNKLQNEQRARLFSMINPNGWIDSASTRGGVRY